MVAKASVFYFLEVGETKKKYIYIYISRGEGTGVLGLGWEFLQVKG